eukprot:17429_1
MPFYTFYTDGDQIHCYEIDSYNDIVVCPCSLCTPTSTHQWIIQIPIFFIVLLLLFAIYKYKQIRILTFCNLQSIVTSSMSFSATIALLFNSILAFCFYEKCEVWQVFLRQADGTLLTIREHEDLAIIQNDTFFEWIGGMCVCLLFLTFTVVLNIYFKAEPSEDSILTICGKKILTSDRLIALYLSFVKFSMCFMVVNYYNIGEPTSFSKLKQGKYCACFNNDAFLYGAQSAMTLFWINLALWVVVICVWCAKLGEVEGTNIFAMLIFPSFFLVTGCVLTMRLFSFYYKILYSAKDILTWIYGVDVSDEYLMMIWGFPVILMIPCLICRKFRQCKKEKKPACDSFIETHVELENVHQKKNTNKNYKD